MLSDFTAPPTVTCFLCKAWISVKKGDKTRFLHHISSDHEVHFDLELIFVLSTMAEGEREAIINNNGQSDSEKEEVEEKEKEEETGNIDVVQEQIRPKRLRVEIKRTKMNDVLHRGAVEDPEFGTRTTLVKCSKCNKRMKRTNLRSHIAANHKRGKKPRKKPEEEEEEKGEMAQQTRNELVELVDVMTKDLTSLVDCMFCDEKLAAADQRAHMKNVHKTDVDPKTLKQEVVSLENSKNPPPTPAAINAEVKVEAKLKKHPGQSVQCGLCYETLARKEKLRQHISQVHPSETELLNTRLEPTFSTEECRVACWNCDMRFITANSRDHHAKLNHLFSQCSPITLT